MSKPRAIYGEARDAFAGWIQLPGFPTAEEMRRMEDRQLLDVCARLQELTTYTPQDAVRGATLPSKPQDSQ